MIFFVVVMWIYLSLLGAGVIGLNSLYNKGREPFLIYEGIMLIISALAALWLGVL